MTRPCLFRVLLLVIAVLDAAHRQSRGETFALAYVDPGLGAMLMQLAMAGVFGLIFHLRSVRQSVGRLFGRLLGRPTAPNGE